MYFFLTLAGLSFSLAWINYHQARKWANAPGMSVYGIAHGLYSCEARKTESATRVACITSSVACGFLFIAGTEWAVGNGLMPRASALGGWEFFVWVSLLTSFMLIAFLLSHLMLYRAAGRLR